MQKFQFGGLHKKRKSCKKPPVKLITTKRRKYCVFTVITILHSVLDVNSFWKNLFCNFLNGSKKRVKKILRFLIPIGNLCKIGLLEPFNHLL